jgi:hypothetical protein
MHFLLLVIGIFAKSNGNQEDILQKAKKSY